MQTYEPDIKTVSKDALQKELRFLVATARAKGERLIRIRCRALSAYRRGILRSTLLSLKREGAVGAFLLHGCYLPEDPSAAYLFEKFPEAEQAILPAGEDEDIAIALLE